MKYIYILYIHYMYMIVYVYVDVYVYVYYMRVYTRSKCHPGPPLTFWLKRPYQKEKSARIVAAITFIDHFSEAYWLEKDHNLFTGYQPYRQIRAVGPLPIAS